MNFLKFEKYYKKFKIISLIILFSTLSNFSLSDHYIRFNYLADGIFDFNSGANGTFGGRKTAGGNSDANGQGDFSMAVPSGYYALNTKNLNTYG